MKKIHPVLWPHQLTWFDPELIPSNTPDSVGIQIAGRCAICGAILKTAGGAIRHQNRHEAEERVDKCPA